MCSGPAADRLFAGHGQHEHRAERGLLDAPREGLMLSLGADAVDIRMSQ
jgi:hypothetical protein